MVKGISRQVILVQSPDQKLFDQAIFVLKDGLEEGSGITEDTLLKEATRLIRTSREGKNPKLYHYGPVWAFGGALATGLLWLLTTVL